MDLINALFSWFAAHPSILIGLGISSIFVFILSLLGVSWFVAQISDDYFLTTKRMPDGLKARAPFLRLILLIGKNLLGVCLIAGGLLMIVLPGQGLITIITGLLLIDYPGKFQLEQKIVSMPSVLKALNWIRIKAKKPLLKRNSDI